jgi:hypothetical protein
MYQKTLEIDPASFKAMAYVSSQSLCWCSLLHQSMKKLLVHGVCDTSPSLPSASMFRWRACRAPCRCWLEALRRPRTGAPEGRPAATTKLAWRGAVNPTRQGGKRGRQQPRGRRMPSFCASCCRMMRSVLVFDFVRLSPANATRLALSRSRLLTPTRAGHYQGTSSMHLWFGTRHVNRISGLTSCAHDTRLAPTSP